MPKGKPKTPTNPAPSNTGAWEASLASTLINNDELKTSVYLISPDKVEDKLQLQILGSAVETNVRQRFVYIEKDSLVAQGKEHGKGKDSGSKTSFPEIFAMLKSADELLPSAVLAKLLKVKILEYRDEELNRREELQQGKTGNASRSPTKSVSPDKGGKKDAKKGGKKSPVKKEGGTNIDPEAEVARGKCPLKKRGEEKEEPAKINDYPEFSPDLFVLCVGFEQADFMAECHKANLPITSLLKSSSLTYSSDFSWMEHISSFNMGSKVVLPDDNEGPEVEARVDAHQELIDKFWEDIAEQATEVPLPAHLVDVGFEKMSLPKLEVDAEIKKDNERMEKLLLALYQRVANKIYSIQSSLCQFKQYYKGMDMVEVADLTERTEDGELLHPLDMRYYNKIISLLPYESVSHVSVLNCMLEQVCEDQQPKKEELKEIGEDPVNKQLGEMIHGLPLTLLQQSEFEGFLSLKQEKVEEDDQPIVLKEADEIRMKSFHLNPKVYPLNDLILLQHSISSAFLELPETNAEVLTKIQSLSYETESFCGQTGQSTVNKALRQFAFENCDHTKTEPGISKLKTPAEYFWDIEMLLGSAEVGVENLQKLKDTEISNPVQRLDHFNYRTSYEKDALLQVLGDAFYEFPYCERIYHRHENAMLLLFHAGYNDKRQSSSLWNERVHTEIGFHYFISRTKDRFPTLLEKLPPLTPAPAPSEATAPPTPVTPAAEEAVEEPEFVMPDNRLEGFKKRSDMKEEEKERASSGKKGKKSAGKGRKGSPSPKRKGSPSKSPKRSAGASRGSSAKSKEDKSKVEFEQVPLVPEPEMDIVMKEDAAKNMFVGFKLPNQIFEATGNVAHCHPADGSLVRVERWGFEGKSPKTRVSLLKGGHVLSLNYVLKSDMDLRNEQRAAKEKQLKQEAEAAAAATPDTGVDSSADIPATEDITTTSALSSVADSQIPLARSVSFNAQLKSGMSMSFKKPVPPPKSVQLDGEDAVLLEEPLPSVMVLSIPNGLVLQYCQQQEDSDYFAIRQTYESKTELKHRCEEVQAKTCAEETSRLCLSNGTVVKHMKNGQTLILYPDGGYSLKHVPPPPPPTPPPEEPVGTPAPLDTGSAAPTPVATPAPPPPYIVWEVTKEKGGREHVMSNGEVEENTPLQCYTATDPESKEVMFTRMDSILSVIRPDGTRIVDHIDGTRITTVTNPCGEVGYKIECVGYATVQYSGSESRTIFGTPTRVISNGNKTFVIEEEGGMDLHISPYENKVELIGTEDIAKKMDPQSLNTIRERGELVYSELGKHQFDLDNEICFDHTDVAGNIFNVSYEGRILTERPDTHIVQHLDHFYKQNAVGAYHEIEEKYRPPMRLFVIHSDHTGSELMDKEKIRTLFESPDKNADIVQVIEDVESDDLAKGYTFLTPYYSSPGSKWVKEFDEGDIVPGGLVYAGTVKPAEQIIGGWEKRVSSPVTTEPELPPAIHYNQVIEETPLNDYHRELVLNGIKAHTQWLIERELNSSKASVPDERTELEKDNAEKMAIRVGRSASKPRTPQNVHRLWRSESKQYASYDSFDEDLLEEDDSSETEDEHLPSAMDRLEKKRNTVEVVTRKYSTAVSNNPFKMKMKLKKGIIPQAKWDQIMVEKMEVNILKSDIRNFRVPPYFDSKFGQSFLSSLREGPDMKGLSENVPSPVQGTPSDKSLENGGKGESLSTSMILIDGEENAGSAISLTQAGAIPTPRPGNPTPNVATGVEGDIPKCSPKQSSPCSDGPSPKANRNLSPVHDEIETPVHDLLSSRQTSQPTSGTVKSLHVDVKGDARKGKVVIPRSIKGYKPGVEPNERFLQQEEPVRRGVKTSSVLAAGRRKHISDMRGFQVYPPEVSFGVLCPGGMYATTVTLKNIGIDSCRFQIKCPKNIEGVSVCLHSETNFVAAGISVKFDVCIQAPEVTEIGHVALDIIITMETEVFRLPVLATVLPMQEYDERSKSGRLTRLPQHIKIIDISSFVNSTSSGARNTPLLSSDWRSTPTFF
ncbi:sperm-associated antigen 17-like isoform X5 [Bolinopsis microptera]|uniref:sperm-associated antigen 17-like isoform X5 n=1 Tax=Bolinopsis microptera TaxID=2820187 RepID=UPI003078DFD3